MDAVMDAGEAGTVIVAGLAAYTVWHAAARKQPPGIRAAYAALPGPIRGFVACPWCFGAWLGFAALLALTAGSWQPAATPVMMLAAAAVPGILDSFTPDDGSTVD